MFILKTKINNALNYRIDTTNINCEGWDICYLSQVNWKKNIF